MSDGFWQSLHLDILWPILVPQLLLMLKQWWDARRVKEAQANIVCKIDDNTQISAAAALGKEQAALMAKGAERAGVEKGIEIERQRSSMPAPLSTGVIDVTRR